MRKLVLVLLASVLVLGVVGEAPRALAQGQRMSYIRDAEIEDIIRTFAAPIFDAAGLTADNIDVYLVNDEQLNAFVAGGQNMFINTGLLMRVESPNQLIGVIAHETGHIAGGHLSRIKDTLRDSYIQSLITTVLGIGAAIATGRPEAASIGIIGGQDVALKNLLSFSRTQESAADHAAVRFLEATGQSSEGLLNFLAVLEDQEILYSSNQDPYLRTHPLTRERVSFLRSHVASSRYSGRNDPPEFIEKFERLQAKLIGFLQPDYIVARRYPPGDNSVAARYARAISFYRRPDLSAALSEIDVLLVEHPDDPFFHELRGQILFENGNAGEALPSYQKAVSLRPGSELLRLGLAQVEVELNRPDLDADALVHLHQVIRHNPSSSLAWRLMAVAYGRQGNIGMSALSLSEAALARGEFKEARRQANRTQQLLPENSPGWLRAQDIDREAIRREDEKDG